MRAFSTVPREFDIKPRVSSWGKFTLATTLCTWSPDELAPLLSVISGVHRQRVVTPAALSSCTDPIRWSSYGSVRGAGSHGRSCPSNGLCFPSPACEIPRLCMGSSASSPGHELLWLHVFLPDGFPTSAGFAWAILHVPELRTSTIRVPVLWCAILWTVARASIIGS
jgi:hypothetical protein